MALLLVLLALVVLLLVVLEELDIGSSAGARCAVEIEVAAVPVIIRGSGVPGCREPLGITLALGLAP